MNTATLHPERITLLLIVAVLFVSLVAFWNLLDAVIIALSLAAVLIPAHRYLCRFVRPSYSSFLLTTVTAIAVFGALSYMGVILYQNSGLLGEMLQSVFSWATDSIPTSDIGIQVTVTELDTLVTEFNEILVDFFSAQLTSIPLIIIKVIIFFCCLFLFFLWGDQIWNDVGTLWSQRQLHVIDRLTVMSTNTLYSIYIVHIATSVLTFLLALPFFWFMGYGNVIFFSLIAAIFQLIPIIGPTLIMLFMALYALSKGDVTGALFFLFIGYPVVCAVPDLLFRPIMMGKRAHVHPVVMWIGFFGGLAVMGLVGFILGPLFLALAVAAYPILIGELKKLREENENEAAQNEGSNA